MEKGYKNNFEPEEKNLLNQDQLNQKCDEHTLNGLEIAKNEMQKGHLFLIDELGSVKIGEHFFQLGSEFGKSFLYKIDTNKFGILGNLEISELTQEILKNFTHIVTISPDGKPKVSPFAVEEMITKKENEAEENYKLRTLIHRDSLSSSARIGLVICRIKSATGLSLADLSHREKISLTNYYLLNSNQHHHKLVSFTKQYGVNGLKAFTAFEYGKQIGDIILDIGEKLPKEKAEEIFSEYNQLVKQAENIAEILSLSDSFVDNRSFDNVRADFPLQIKEAICRRAKDILYTVSAIAKNKVAKADFFQSGELESKDVNESIEALKKYKEALEQIQCLIQPNDKNNNYKLEFIDSEKGIPESYSFVVIGKEQKKSFLTIQLREYGAEIDRHNQAREFDGEARINFLFSQDPIDLDISNASRLSAMSIRLDREGKTRKDGKIISNDPTKKEGELSIDVGSAQDTIGKVISIGNALSQQVENPQKNPQYYHNRESFSKNLGDADVFAEMVRIIRKKIILHYVSQQKDYQNQLEAA